MLWDWKVVFPEISVCFTVYFPALISLSLCARHAVNKETSHVDFGACTNAGWPFFTNDTYVGLKIETLNLKVEYHSSHRQLLMKLMSACFYGKFQPGHSHCLQREETM